MERTADTSGHSISHFDFLNTSVDHEVNFRRERLDGWYREYATRHPKEARDLRQRFRSTDDEHHFAAMHELYTHHILLENGYEIQPHPPLKESQKRPEFLASKDGDPRFYVECAIVFNGPERKRATKFEAAILDAVNRVRSKDFLILVDFAKTDQTNPPAVSKIVKAVEQKINEVDYDGVIATYGKDNSLPTIEWRQDDWEVNLRLSPVTEEARELRADENSRNVGIIQHPVRHIETDEQIKSKIEAKTKYGKLDLPFVVSINLMTEDGIFFDDRTMMSALFGKEQLVFYENSSGRMDATSTRNFQGAFVRPPGRPINTRVSGVIAMSGQVGWKRGKIKQKLWLHPWAEKPLPLDALNIPYAKYNEETKRMEGVDLKK